MSADDDATERSIGRRDVTHWATPLGRGLAGAHHRLTHRVGHHGALAATLAIGGGIAVAATYAAATIYDSVADSNGIESIDKPVLHKAMTLRSPGANAIAAGIARVFGPIGMPVGAVTAAALISVRQKSPVPAILLSAAGAGSLLMTVGGKDLIRRHRPPKRDAAPPYEMSPSFPSGHTLNATTIVGLVAYLLALKQKRQPPQVAIIGTAAVTVASVGLSRVLLGAHWFTDVLTGWTTGTGWLALIITSHRLYLTNKPDA
jgi:undecaprenyl-diphosphatase